MTAPEFSRPVRVDTLGDGAAPRSTIEAERGERDGARRGASGWSRIDRLAAELDADAARATRSRCAGTLAARGHPGLRRHRRAGRGRRSRRRSTSLFRPQPEAARPTRRSSSARASSTSSSTTAARSTSARRSPRPLLLNLDPYPRAPGAEAGAQGGGREERGGSRPVRRAGRAQGQAEALTVFQRKLESHLRQGARSQLRWDDGLSGPSERNVVVEVAVEGRLRPGLLARRGAAEIAAAASP